MSLISLFWGPAPPWLQSYVAPLCERLRLSALPPHIHQVIISFILYQSIHSFFSPFFSRRLFPSIYPNLKQRTRLNWDIHVVALVQAIVISVLSLYVEFASEERKAMITPVDRLFGYVASSGTVGAMALGYFLWDTLVCVRYFKLFGPGMLAHGISALSVYSAGFVSCHPPFFFFLLQCIQNREERANANVRRSAPLPQLLLLHFPPLRTLLPLPQHPLVLRQTQPHRLFHPMVQRHAPPPLLPLLPSGLGNLPQHPLQH